MSRMVKVWGSLTLCALGAAKPESCLFTIGFLYIWIQNMREIDSNSNDDHTNINHNSRKHWYKLLERQSRIFKVFCDLEYFVLFFILFFFVCKLSFAAACLFHCIAPPGCSRLRVDLLTYMAWKIHLWRTRPRTTVVAQKRMLCIYTHALYYVILCRYI